MQARDILQDLNRNYVRSAQETDLRWYEENLAEDFVSGNPDGSFADKAGFLARMARGAAGTEYAAQDVRIHMVGDVALIHAGFSYRRPDGRLHLGSYTDTWALRNGRWLCVGAQFQLFAGDHETLQYLNGEYIRAVRESDAGWFDRHLAADFLNSNPDGSLIDKGAFLKQIAPPCPVKNLQIEDVRIRIFGDFAQAHARTTYGKPDGSAGAGRYTDSWHRREGRWLCVSAHVGRN
jgi:ketosteroid isomerase-like protein